MHKRLVAILLSLALAACATQTRKAADTAPNPLAPIMLDDLHYYSVKSEELTRFFTGTMGAKRMREISANPLGFIRFYLLSPGQATVNISPKGPFPGIFVGDPKRWEKETVPPAPDLPPMYGVHWLAFSTRDLAGALERMARDGVHIVSRNFSLPTEPGAKAAAVYTPDFNLVVLVERRGTNAKTDFAIDHLQLLVRDVPANVKFYADVFRGEVLREGARGTDMNIGRHRFVLSDPAALGLAKERVVMRDPKQFRSNIDHLGFLYSDTQPAYEHAVAKGYQFLLKPTPLKYYGAPTPYSFGILFSPDGLQCEMVVEQGRIDARTQYEE
jgi:catechol 2,3-dioxygenase-like lactoylglutathione lyase family enzyme